MFNFLKKLWRKISPAAEAAWALGLKTVAIDLVRQYVARNPRTPFYQKEIAELVDSLAKITGTKQTTAVRIIEAAIHEVGGLIGQSTSNKPE